MGAQKSGARGQPLRLVPARPFTGSEEAWPRTALWAGLAQAGFPRKQPGDKNKRWLASNHRMGADRAAAAPWAGPAVQCTRPTHPDPDPDPDHRLSRGDMLHGGGGGVPTCGSQIHDDVKAAAVASHDCPFLHV